MMSPQEIYAELGFVRRLLRSSVPLDAITREGVAQLIDALEASLLVLNQMTDELTDLATRIASTGEEKRVGS